MRRLDCGYDLSRLSEHRCPECGRGFDPNDSRTFALEHACRYPDWLFLLIFLAFYLVLAGCAAIVLMREIIRGINC